MPAHIEQIDNCCLTYDYVDDCVTVVYRKRRAYVYGTKATRLLRGTHAQRLAILRPIKRNVDALEKGAS